MNRTHRSRRPSSNLEILESRVAPANLIWTGDVDGNWGTNNTGNTNWSGDLLPQDGDTLIFPSGGANRINTNNMTGLDLVAIELAGIDYLIGGNAISLTSGISDGSSNGANSVNLSIAFAADQSISVSELSTRLVLGGLLSGANAVAKSGAGILRLTGNVESAHTGSFTVADGTLELQHTVATNAIVGPLIIGDGIGDGMSARVVLASANNIGDSVVVTVGSDGSLELGSFFETIGGLTLFSGAASGPTVATGSATLTVAGNIALGSGGAMSATINGTLSFGSATRTIFVADGEANADLTINATITGTGSAGLTKLGPGTLRLAGATPNSLPGDTTVGEGILELAKFNAISAGTLTVGDILGSAGSAKVSVTVGDAIANSVGVVISPDGLLQLSGTSETIASLVMASGTTSGGQVTTGSFFLTVNGTVALSVSGTGAVGASILGNLNLGGGTRTFFMTDGEAAVDLSIEGSVSSGGVVKTEAGTLRLAGTIFYAGSTTVTAGTLLIDGVMTGGGPVSIASGATLAGSGSVFGAVTMAAGGMLTPGGNPGMLSLGSLDLANGGVFTVELNGPVPGTGYDQLSVVGAVVLGGARLQVIPGYPPTVGDELTILNNDGTDAISGTFAGLAEGAAFSIDGRRFAITYEGGDGNDIVLTALSPVEISANGRTAQFDDGDGDRVTVKLTGNGKLLPGDFLFSGFGGNTLTELRLDRAAFEGANVTITAKPGRSGGNGIVNVGFLNASGTDLGVVKISGDLGRIIAGNEDADPAVKSLAVQSIGVLGTSTQGMGGDLVSVFTGNAGSLKVRSDVRDARITSTGNLAGVVVTGSIVASSIQAGAALGNVTVRGDILGTLSDPVILSAVGQSTPANGKPDQAIGAIKVAGGVEFLRVLGGYDLSLNPANADASIGKVMVAGDWRASSILAGTDDAGNRLGGVNDSARFSRIAGIVIKGQILGTAAAGDSYGIFADQIVSAKIGTGTLKLDRGENDLADAFALSPFPGPGGSISDFFLREVT